MEALKKKNYKISVRFLATAQNIGRGRTIPLNGSISPVWSHFCLQVICLVSRFERRWRRARSRRRARDAGWAASGSDVYVQPVCSAVCVCVCVCSEAFWTGQSSRYVIELKEMSQKPLDAHGDGNLNRLRPRIVSSQQV